MKRVSILILLLVVACVAGVVRSYSKRGVSLSQLPRVMSGDSNSKGEAREEIRKSYELSPGARVEISGINGAVRVEAVDGNTAEIYIERTGRSPEALSRRKVTIQNSSNSLTIRGEKGDAGFFARLFGSNPSERVTLKLPKQVSLFAKGINGAVNVGELEGAVKVYGVNGKVDIAQAAGSADFKGINGDISVGLKDIDNEGVRIEGVNGNIDLRLNQGLNADLEAHGMNGTVISEARDVTVEKTTHGSYYAHVGSGGNPISAKGINGNIRLSRPGGNG